MLVYFDKLKILKRYSITVRRRLRTKKTDVLLFFFVSYTVVYRFQSEILNRAKRKNLSLRKGN